MDKLRFKYSDMNGDTQTDVSLYPDQTKILEVEANFYKGVAFVEREWRNAEFLATDYMLLPRARAQGVFLEGTDKLQDINDYRDALHSYDVEGKGDRPTRPTWFIEE